MGISHAPSYSGQGERHVPDDDLLAGQWRPAKSGVELATKAAIAFAAADAYGHVPTDIAKAEAKILADQDGETVTDYRSSPRLDTSLEVP